MMERGEELGNAGIQKEERPSKGGNRDFIEFR